MAMKQLEGWLDWQLKHGSHDFPGPDGGTCINEAAVVVAGFSYREVTSITDLPESFCPVISQYALTLNDAMSEGELLNRLRPFAARLSGSSDSRKRVSERALYLAMRAAQIFAPLALEAVDALEARRLRRTAAPEDVMRELDRLARRPWPDDIREAVGAAQRALARARATKNAIYTAELAAVSAVRAAAVNESAWDRAIEALEGVLVIGRQTDPVETELIDQRATQVLATS